MKKYLVLGLVSVLLLSSFAILGASAAKNVVESTIGEKHMYLVLGYQGSGVLRDYGKMKLVISTPEDVMHYPYYVNVDYMRSIHIGSLSFDPDKMSPGIPAELKKETSKYYIVQFNGPVDKNDLRELTTVGHIIWYLPYNAYVVRMTSSPDSLMKLDNVRWNGIYQPYFKLSKELQDMYIQDPGIPTPHGEPTVMQSDYIHVRVIEWSNQLHQIRMMKNVKEMRIGNLIYLTGDIEKNKITELANEDDVLYIEKYVEPKLMDEKSDEIIGGAYGGDGSWVNSHLLKGDGIIVAVADTGIDTGSKGIMHPDLKDRVIAFWSANGDDAHDGHGHGTHVSGIIAGTAATGERDSDGYLYGYGVAPHAHLVEEKIFSDSGAWLAPNYITLGEFAQANGAIISSNSWGANTGGEYTSDSQIYDIMTRDANPDLNGSQELLFVFAAGNAGSGAQTVGSPGTAKNVLTVGAVGNDRFGDNYENVASFSSRGPAADGRLKPDVVAPGTWIASALSQDARPGWAWGNIDKWYEWCGGTSQATPHVSGAAALFAQYYEGIYGKVPSPALIKAALINTAIDVNGTDAQAPIPNNNEGWGMVYLPNLIDPPYGEVFMDENHTLQTGQTYTFNVSVRDNSHPLKITMTYTDKEAAPNANPTLVNDLNLVVHGPNGETYIGNNFANGWTQVGNSNPDNLNNTENVYIQNPAIGNYTVEIIAQNVPEDAVPDTSAVDQDFAIVITGDVGKVNHYSSVRFSKQYYQPGDSVDVFAIDSYANTNPAEQDLVKCDLTSVTTGDTERLVLMETSKDSGVFNASIPTEIGPANPGDGILQVNRSDVITASYKDYLGSMRSAKTIIDGVPPVVNGVSVGDVKSTSVVIHVRTSEITSLKIYYGTPGHMGNVSYDGYTTDHYVKINGLIPYTRYYFDIYAEDKAGNGIYDDNSGNHYLFRTALPPSILLVADDGGNYQYSSAFIAYELDDLGYSYDVWDTTTLGSPSYDVISSYTIVVWNTGPDYSSDTLTTMDQNNLERYMDSGGRLILMGQDIIWGIGVVDLFTKYFHISSVNQDAISGTKTTVYGVSGNPITGNYTSGLSLNSTYDLWIDELTTDGSSEVSNLFMDTNNKPIGVMVNNSTYRAIFMAFPYECLAVDEYPAAKNITWNMIRWILPEKDVYSLYLQGNEWTIVGENYSINVLLSNKDNVEHSTDVHFYIENSTGNVVYSDSKNVSVNAGEGLWLSFSWVASKEDIYTMHVGVNPAAGEGVLLNNNVSMPLYARQLLGTLNVVVVDSWISDYSQYGDLDYMSEHWYMYGDYKLHFDTQSLNKEGITINDILSTNPDVLFISNAWGKEYGWEYTDNEINAIKVAVAMGHGIVTTFGTFDSADAPNNMKLAPIFGLNSSVGGNLIYTVHNYTIYNATHPVFNGLRSPVAIGYGYAMGGLVTDGARILAETDVASSTGGTGNITDYKYGGGESLYSPTMLEFQSSSDDEKKMFYNMLLYAYLNSSPIDYDLAALNITTDRPWVEPGNTVNVTANVMNAGTHDDTGTVKLYATYPNGTKVLIGEKSVYIAHNSSSKVIFTFSSAAEGRILLTAEISSPNDMISDDNVTSGYIYSRIPRGTVLVAGVDSLGSAYPSMMVWNELKENWYMYGNHTLEFDMGTLSGKNITYQDLVNSKADVLYISDAWNNYPSSGVWWEFSDSEIAAIKQYVSEGHGLIMSSGTLNVDNVPNNMKLASLAGLDPTASQHWATTFSTVFNINMSYNESKYIFAGIDNPYVCGLDYTDYGWALNSSDPADLIANSTDNYAGIFFHKYSLGSVIYFSHLPEYAANANDADKQLVYNAIVFTYENSTQPVVDNSKPSVKINTPSDGEVLSGMMSVQVNATDNVSWIPQVNVYIVNATNNMSYNTTHDYSAGVFKVSIDTRSLADGNYTIVARAVDYYGNVNWTSVNVTIDNTAPLISILGPHENQIIVNSNITVNWSVVDPHLEYVFLEIDGGSWINVTAVQNYTFHNLSVGTHTVVVRATDIVGNAASKGVDFRITAAPVPSAPQNISAIAGLGYINLTWEAPVDNGSSTIIEYRIYRGTASGGEVYIGNVSGSQLYFNDTHVADGTTYYYFVTAVNGNGEGEQSNEVSATTMTIPELEMFVMPVILIGIAAYEIKRRR